MDCKVLLACPVCGGELVATRLRCRSCEVAIEGHFAASPFAKLSWQQEEFVRTFLAARGNIKLAERQLGISYPTVRNRLEEIQRVLGLVDLADGQEQREEQQRDVGEILGRLESGQLSVDEAIDSLGRKED